MAFEEIGRPNGEISLGRFVRMHGPQLHGRLFTLLFWLLLALGCTSSVLFVVHTASFCELCAATVHAHTRPREQLDAGATSTATATVVGAGAAAMTTPVLVLFVLASDQSEQRVPSCILASDTAGLSLTTVGNAETDF